MSRSYKRFKIANVGSPSYPMYGIFDPSGKRIATTLFPSEFHKIVDEYLDVEHTYEVCPHCGEEVKLKAELKVQICPNCGKHIVTCSMCLAADLNDSEHPYCKFCCLCQYAEVQNEEGK